MWEACEAFLQGLGEEREGVDQEVFSCWRRGDFCIPAQGKVDGGESYFEVPGRVLGPERGERGEGLREFSRGWLGVWRGVGHSKGGQASTVPAV